MAHSELTAVTGARAWYGPDMDAQREQWTFRLTAAHVEELDAAIKGVEERRLGIVSIRRADFPLAQLGKLLRRIRDELQDGRGFALLRGLPVERYSVQQAAIAYFGIGAHLGDAVSQNAKGHALGHVYNLGVDPTLPTGRGYQSDQKLNFHTDPTDVVGLLCLRKAKAGGLSSIVSAGTVYNEVLRQRPDLVRELMGTFYRDRRGEIPEGREPWYRLPVFNFRDGRLLTNYVRSTIEKAQRFEQIPRLTDPQLEAFALLERTAADPKLYLNMTFEPGDIQFLNNHFIMHSRTAYEDFEEPHLRRHLLRLWLACDDGPPLPNPYFEFMDKTAAGRPNGYLMPGVDLTAPLTPEDGGPGSTGQRSAQPAT
ncbi:MAG: TauD/TfdA family dioxygenase [Chromatiales bacterium]|jgi:hypothetical protein|nr:TauD/TfdA family dioxygenase [Chromatiales bacterium]